MRRLLLCLLVLTSLASQAMAEEAIADFFSDVTVDIDASLTVTEVITVNVEGDSIRHGIKRDFPTAYAGRRGQRVRVGFDVLQVKRDGRPEPYSIESISNGKSIKIGDADVWLQNGAHAYEITYRTTRQIGFFEKFDELYWNVTGNGWDFAIDRATAIVHLPYGARIEQHSEYTGAQDSAANDSEVTAASGNYYSATTTRRLDRHEGFTVAVAWQKGIVTPPSGSQKWRWWLGDNAGIFGLIVTLLAAAAYYLYAWNKVGRDPPTGTIIPLFAPPRNLGPAGTRYVWKMGFDNQAFAAALVGLAVKKRLKIGEDGSFTITKLQPPAGAPPLTAAEQALYAALPSGTTTLEQSNHAAVRAVRTALEDSLSGEYEGTVFMRNLGWFAIGAGISIAGLAISALLLSSTGSPVFYMLVGAAMLLGVMGLAFFFLLRAPTVPGRRLLDQIEGFRLYMTTAEEERLKVLHPPEKTPELFERYLPYAMALDCENEWNAKFAAVLAAAAAAGASAPTWYSGSHWGSGGFTQDLGSSLSSSVASASAAPGSSSGSSGGGSSGGGGGGGGGSGW